MEIKEKPLTLEQLRKMDGQPVWGVSLKDNFSEWFIVRVIELSHSWFIACAGSQRGFGDKDTYGETWVAYAYLPAHIIREAWEPCYMCKDDNCATCINVGLYRGYAPCNTCYDEGNQYEAASFCPNCGRPLTVDAWEELEKRLNMVIEPTGGKS